MYALLSASSGLFLSRNVLLGLSSVLPLSLSPRSPMVLSQKALCVEQTDSNLHISLQTPTGMPGEHPNTSQKQLFKWSRAANRDCVCSSLALWASGPASSGMKPWAQMFALLAGSPESSCLLIDDNLHNDTTHSDAARHEGSLGTPHAIPCWLAESLSSSMQATKTARARKCLIQRCPL